MSFQEEPESQIDSLLHQHTNERDSPPAFDIDLHGHSHHKPSPAHNSDELGSDDTVLDENNAIISSPISRNDALESQVKETQYVPVEFDTQPSIDYDVSPTTQRVLDNIESSSAGLPPPKMVLPLLEIRAVPDLPDGPEFRFGKPPNLNNMKLNRPPPGPNRPHREETTNTETLMPPKANLPLNHSGALSTTISTLHGHSGPPKGIFPFEADLGSTRIETESEPPHSPNQATGQIDEAPEVASLHLQSCSTTIASGCGSGIEKASPRSSRELFEEAGAPLNTTMRAELLTTMKSHSLANHDSRPPNQPRRQAKSGSPPFIEASLSSDARPNTTELPATTMTPASTACASNVSNAPLTAEIRNSKPNRSASRLIAESVETDGGQESSIPIDHPHKPGSTVKSVQDVIVYDKVDHDDITRPALSDNGLSPSREVLRDVSRNHRPGSRNKNTNRSSPHHATRRLPSVEALNRPLPEYHIDSQDVRENQELHSTRDSRVQKKGSPRASSAHHIQSNNTVSTGSSETIDATGLLQMAMVMFTAEKGQLEKEVVAAQFQIEGLSKEKAALRDRIECLSKKNQDLLDKHVEFRTRSERYKAKMNDVMRSQKELNADAKSLDRRRFDLLRKAAKEMDVEMLKAKAQVSKDHRVVLNEARLELDRQNKTIELLKRDINHQLLDLQRERGFRETLQKQLEGREKQQEELKSVLFDHQRNAVAILSRHEDLLTNVLNAGADGAMRLTECRALIKNLNESQPKPIPALIELNELVVALSTSVEEKVRAAEDGNIQVRDAGVEVLSELKHRLELISEDQSAQRILNANIADLREENAKLNERIQYREKEFSVVEKHLNETKLELQQCRTRLAATNEDLKKAITAPQEDVLLRTQLQDLQTSYSIAIKQADSSASEIERVRGDLHKQESLTLLAQEETSRLQEIVRQSEAKVFAFDVQRESYVRQMKDESNTLRLNMERHFSARLAEDEARHNGIVSGLRRQITEADNKLAQINQKLHDAERARLNNEDETHGISKQVSVVAMELGSLQGKARSMEQTRVQTDSEIHISQEQLNQYMKKAADWSARAEENALEFAKRRNEIDDGFKKSKKVAEVEVDRLGALVLTLQKKNEDSQTVISNVARYLRSKGVLRPGLSFSDWARGLPREQFQQEETTIHPPHPLVNSELDDAPAPDLGGSFHGSRKIVRTSTVSSSNKEADDSAQLTGEHICLAANPLCESSDENRRKRLTEADTSLLLSCSKPSRKRTGQDEYTHKQHLSTGSLELAIASSPSSEAPQQFSATKAVTRSAPRANDHYSASNISFNKTKTLEVSARTVIPDSQEDLTQEQIPPFARPPRRIAKRPQNMAKGNRKVTQTEVTGYSIRTSETYIENPTAQHNERDHVLLRNQATDLNSVDSDVESSDLSEPPDNVDKFDLEDFMDSGHGTDLKDPAISRFSDEKAHADSMPSHPVLSPKPNSSRARTGRPVRLPEANQPKGILKKPNNVIQKTDIKVDANSSRNTLETSQLLKLQSNNVEAAANRRLSRTISGTSGRDGALHRSPYNRPVVGSKDLHKSNHFQAPDVPHHVERPSAADIFTISSSPAMGQPQRNSKKRALSGVSMNDNNRPTKLSRSIRH